MRPSRRLVGAVVTSQNQKNTKNILGKVWSDTDRRFQAKTHRVKQQVNISSCQGEEVIKNNADYNEDK